MSHQEIVETRGKYRAKIEIDEAPHEPDGDVFGSIITLWRLRTEVRNQGQNSDDDFGIGAAWERFGDMELVERYVRMFQGAVGFDYFDTEEAKYVNVITLADLTAWGWDTLEEWRDKFPDEDPSRNNLDEWRAYVEGDVWNVMVQKNVTWHTSDEDFDDHDSWEDVDDTVVGGYYGEEWARQAVTEALDDYAPRPCRKCGEPLKRDETQQPPWPWVHVDGNTDHEADGSVLP